MNTHATGAIAIAIAAIAGAAQGQDDAFWTGTDGMWSTGASWSLGVVPNNNGNQTFNATLNAQQDPYTVTLDIDATIENFTLSGVGVTLALDLDRRLTVNQDATISGGTVSGAGTGSGGIVVAGTLTLDDASLVGAGDIRATGGVNIMSSSNVDICNTCVTGGGSSGVTGSGGISLNQGGDLTNELGGNFSIVADSNRSITGDGTGSFNNEGTLNSLVSSRGTSGATNFSQITFNNTGTLNVFSGQVSIDSVNDFTVNNTLNEGVWNVFDGSSLSLGNNTFDRLGAEINISGSDANFNGIQQLRTIEAGGKFGIFNGQNFSGGQGIGTFSNDGEIEVGNGSTFSTAIMGLSNLDDDGIFGGKYVIAGEFVTGAKIIRLLEADLTLIGADSVFTGIEGLDRVGGFGRIELAGGRNFTTFGDLSVDDGGLVKIGAGSTFDIVGELSNNGILGLFDAAAFDVEGTLIASNLNIIEISNELILDGMGSQLLDANGNDAIAGLRRIREDGILRLRNGRSLTNLDNLIVDGILSIEGDPADGFSRGSPSGTVQVNGNTLFSAASTLEIIIDGTDVSMYGQLDSGSVDVEAGATLALVVDRGVSLSMGDEFAVVVTDSMNGVFTNFVGLDIGDGLSFEVLQDGTGVIARVVPAPGVGGVLMVLGLAASRRRR